MENQDRELIREALSAEIKRRKDLHERMAFDPSGQYSDAQIGQLYRTAVRLQALLEMELVPIDWVAEEPKPKRRKRKVKEPELQIDEEQNEPEQPEPV